MENSFPSFMDAPIGSTTKENSFPSFQTDGKEFSVVVDPKEKAAFFFWSTTTEKEIEMLPLPVKYQRCFSSSRSNIILALRLQ